MKPNINRIFYCFNYLGASGTDYSVSEQHLLTNSNFLSELFHINCNCKTKFINTTSLQAQSSQDVQVCPTYNRHLIWHVFMIQTLLRMWEFRGVLKKILAIGIDGSAKSSWKVQLDKMVSINQKVISLMFFFSGASIIAAEEKSAREFQRNTTREKECGTE